MATDTALAQPSDDQLDVVQHPTLGTLKFPKDMPYDQRNQIIGGMETDQLRTGKGMEHPIAPIPIPGSLSTAIAKSRLVDQYDAQQKQPPAGVAGVEDIAAGNVSRGAHTLISARAKALSPLAVPAIAAAPVATIAAGAMGLAGKYAARKGADLLGASEDQQSLAGDVGSIAGGYLGSRIPEIGDLGQGLAKILRDPDTGKVTVTPSTIAERFIPKRLDANPPGWSVRLPGTMPPSPEAAPPQLGSPENPGWVAPLPNRMPRTSLGLSTVPGVNLPGVTIVPEPRPAFPGEEPNYMGSIPRGKLPSLAVSGKPGAATQLQQLGKTVLYVPPEGYPDPRIRVNAEDLLK